MGDGRINRAIEQGRARTSDIKARVPELKDRLPELGERSAELRQRGSDLRSRVPELRAEVARQYARMDVSWARGVPAQALRHVLLSGILGPMIDWYVRSSSTGRDVFDEIRPPVMFVANHSSHLDTPTILRALPRRWRARTAVAAAADYFYKNRWKANGVALLFNTVPIGREGGGLGDGATDHVDQLIDDGWNLLLYPEGTRSRDGSVAKPRSGAAVIAAMHGVPIVPIYVDGTFETMPPGQNWPRRIPGRLFTRRHRVEIRFGRPIPVPDIAARKQAMREVHAFWDRRGLPEDPAATQAHDVLLIHEVLRAHEASLARTGGGRFDPVLPLLADPVEDRTAPAA